MESKVCITEGCTNAVELNSGTDYCTGCHVDDMPSLDPYLSACHWLGQAVVNLDSGLSIEKGSRCHKGLAKLCELLSDRDRDRDQLIRELTGSLKAVQRDASALLERLKPRT